MAAEFVIELRESDAGKSTSAAPAASPPVVGPPPKPVSGVPVIPPPFAMAPAPPLPRSYAAPTPMPSPLPRGPATPPPLPAGLSAPPPIPGPLGTPRPPGLPMVVTLSHIPLPVTIVGGQTPQPAGKPKEPEPPTVAQQSFRASAKLGIAGAAGAYAAGRAGAAIADNDLLGAVTTSAHAAAGALSLIPVVGPPLAAGLEIATASVKGFAAVVGAFNERAEQLAAFSPELAVAKAQADVRTLMADIREAQTLGPDYARMVEVESQVMIEIRELLMPIKKALLESVVILMESLRDWAPILAEVLKEIASILNQIFKFLISILPGGKDAVKAMEEARKALDAERQMQERRDIATGRSLLERFMQFPAAGIRLPGTDPGGNDNDRRPGPGIALGGIG